MRAVFAGSFDPFTLGHKEMVMEALKIFPSVCILVSPDSIEKKYTFTLEQRIVLIQESCKGLPVTVEVIDGLLPENLAPTDVLVRGIRSATNYEYERNLHYGYNSISQGNINIIYLFPKEHQFTSSTLVRTLLTYNSSAIKEHIVPDIYDLVMYWYRKNTGKI